MDWKLGVYSDGSKSFLSNPNPKKGEEVVIKIRFFEWDKLEAVFLRVKYNGVEVLEKLNFIENKNGFNYYKVNIKYYEDNLKYCFIIKRQDEIFYYNQYGVFDYQPNENYDFKLLYDYQQPTWVKESIFYQIFPERFFNGNPDNDVEDNEYTFDNFKTQKIKNWNDAPKDYEHAHCLDFYGGDLEGIKMKIPYLKKLGVTALYLNPIFYAATVHKYDCLDYFQIDPHFGGEKALIELIEELHKNGMKIILDISINHTGTANKWFNMEGIFFDKSIGAYNNKDSLEREYYFFDEKNNYKSWLGVKTLPTLNYTSKKLRGIIYENEDSVIKKYLKAPFNIDGWRFDVADTLARNDFIQIQHEIWPDIRKSIKEENKDAFILAEDWTDCRQFLRGNEWDSSMNYYGFGRVIREFLNEGDTHLVRHMELCNYKATAKMFTNRLKEHYLSLPFLIQENQFNLFDSHDISRLHNNKNIDFLSYRLAAICLFTMIGAPNLYYGDEIGLDGEFTMEGCRYPMNWDTDKESNEYYKLYSKLCQIKKSNDALKYGSVRFLESYKNLFAYARISENDVILVIGSLDNSIISYNIFLEMFGTNYKMPKEDLFNKKLDYEACNNIITINIKPKDCFIIKLINKNED